MKTTYAMILAALTLTACEHGLPSGDPGPAPDDAPPASLARMQAELLCDVIERCDLPRDLVLYQSAAENRPADCVGYFEARITRSQERNGYRDPGVDAARFERCRVFALDTCTVPGAGFGCGDFIAGDVPEHGSCEHDPLSCAPGLFCDVTHANSRVTCGAVCTARRAPGERCIEDAECASGDDFVSVCKGYVDGQGTCTRITASGSAEVGEPCGWFVDDDGIDRVGCADGAWCDAHMVPPPRGSSVGTCQPTLRAGDACEDGGTSCHEGHCVDGTCRFIELMAVPGAPCDLDAGGAWCNPLAGLLCDPVEHVCVATHGWPGDRCDRDQGVDCRPGAFCDAGVCRAQVEIGEPCPWVEDEAVDVCRAGICDEDGICAEQRLGSICR